MIPTPTLVIDALAAYRITRLVTADDITAPPREALIRLDYIAAGRAPDPTDPDRVLTDDMTPAPDDTWTDVALTDDDPPALAKVLTCRWCAGIWVGFGVVAARRFAPRLWDPIARVLAAGAVAALLAAVED